MPYTQDESYYLLDAGPKACVYLGLQRGLDRAAWCAICAGRRTAALAFPDELYVNRWPAKKHDHFLIPAGTVHCSGKNSMVLEISATPYIFTFKLWDWGRLGLDGRPRPIHLDHGAGQHPVGAHDRVGRARAHQPHRAARPGDGWREERTGLHEREFIETRRHWFTTRRRTTPVAA